MCLAPGHGGHPGHPGGPPLSARPLRVREYRGARGSPPHHPTRPPLATGTLHKNTVHFPPRKNIIFLMLLLLCCFFLVIDSSAYLPDPRPASLHSKVLPLDLAPRMTSAKDYVFPHSLLSPRNFSLFFYLILISNF